MSDLILKVAKKAAPTGKAQKAIMEYLESKGLKQSDGSVDLNDMARHPDFRGMHLAAIMSAAEALDQKGLIEFDGVTLKKK
jgi:hypothetical protein